MPFINKVTVRGTTYYLENLTNGSDIARLPTSAQGLKANDTLVTEGTLGKFTVTPGQLEDFKIEVKTDFSVHSLAFAALTAPIGRVTGVDSAPSLLPTHCNVALPLNTL